MMWVEQALQSLVNLCFTARHAVKSGSDPRGTPNTDGSGVRKGGVRRAKSNTEVVFGRGAHGGMSMDARIRLRVDKHAGGP